MAQGGPPGVGQASVAVFDPNACDMYPFARATQLYADASHDEATQACVLLLKSFRASTRQRQVTEDKTNFTHRVCG